MLLPTNYEEIIVEWNVYTLTVLQKLLSDQFDVVVWNASSANSDFFYFNSRPLCLVQRVKVKVKVKVGVSH